MQIRQAIAAPRENKELLDRCWRLDLADDIHNPLRNNDNLFDRPAFKRPDDRL